MPSMKQNPKTDYGKKGETGEKEPKRATSSDTSGERKEGLKGGVAMGKADKTDRSGNGSHDYGEYNEGRSEKVCYEHKRLPHDQGHVDSRSNSSYTPKTSA